MHVVSASDSMTMDDGSPFTDIQCAFSNKYFLL